MDLLQTNFENFNVDNQSNLMDDRCYDVLTETQHLSTGRFNNIMGVTCYMNSILYILQQIPEFVNYIYNFDCEKIIYEKTNTFGNFITDYVVYELHRLFKKSIDYEDNVITPTTFKKLIGIKNEMWNEYNQQDSQEFFNFLISQIKEEIGIKTQFINTKNYENDRNPINSIDNIIATNGLTNYESQEYSILTELFDGLYKNKCLCEYCNSYNVKVEPFLTLAVDIDISRCDNDLYDCLDNLCHPQQLDDNNKLTCGFCGVSNKSYNQLLLWKTPKILVIHIKRFGFENEKIIDNILYPINNFNIYNYIDPNSPYISECNYDLFGINLHESIDDNITCGHYTSLIKNRINNNWYYHNDSCEPELIDDTKLLQNNNAYLLFYRRQ